MTRTPSPRMRLTIESSDELIDQWGYNWPILDSFAGVQLVGAGVMPPNSQLWDGALVAEKTTGIVWMAHLRPDTGAYEKKFLVYPFAALCYNTAFSFVTGGAFKDYPMTTWLANQSINFNGLVNNRVVAPVDGVYAVDGTVSWDTYGVGAREMLISFNGADDYMRNEDLLDANNKGKRDISHMAEYTKLKAGDTVGLRGWQNSGITINNNVCYLNVELISPL